MDAKNWVCSMDFNKEDGPNVSFGTTNGMLGRLLFQTTAQTADAQFVSFNTSLAFPCMLGFFS